MEWTREKTLSLINEYRQRRGLWDMTCDDYRKKDVKQKLLCEVRDSLGGEIPIPELEKKFHTLRTQYHREISRMKRKEPYNSKWFGFKNLQFLSSPRACRSNKGRVKSEITEEGTVTKYVISDQPTSSADNSGGSSTSNMNDEYLTIPRKTHTVSNRAKELERLIEETTKDGEDIEDAKPKLIVKTINVPYEQSYNSEMHVTETQHIEQHSTQDSVHQHQQRHQQQHQQSIEEMEQPSTIEAVSFQANENGELHYQSTPNSTNNSVHPHLAPPRLYKIPRRETTSQEDTYYNAESHDQQQQPQQTKRIYYDTSTHSTTILATPTMVTTPPNGSSTIINPATLKQRGGTVCVGLPQTKSADSQLVRDEFTTYGEYVANEMRAIGNREVLIALKHKINTAIFEANMDELQK